MPSRSVSLTPEQDAFIDEVLEPGEYRNANEAVGDAIRSLQKQRALDALKPKAAWYKVTVDRGLYLRVATDGRKTWHVRYVVGGKQVQAMLSRPYASTSDGGAGPRS